MCDPKGIAEEKRIFLVEWLGKAKAVQKAIPQVQSQLDIASWESSALSDAPDQMIRTVGGTLSKSLKQDLSIIKKALPEIPSLSATAFNAMSANVSATATEVYLVTDRARQADDPRLYEWGTRHSQFYENLQERLGRERDVQTLLSKLKDSLSSEFESACNSFRRTTSGIDTQQSAGIAMRNVLEHYKGELMNRAKRSPREQKVNWEDMAERLVNDDGISRNQFVQQSIRWNELQQCLSKLAKGHIDLTADQLRSTFTQFVDHIYIVLSLAEPGLAAK